MHYLQKLKEWQPNYYGCLFYDADEMVLAEKTVQNVPVLLGINRYGIHTFQREKDSGKKRGKDSANTGHLIHQRTSLFEDILGWAIHTPTNSFIYTVHSDSDEGKHFHFETELAAELPDLCQGYVHLIINANTGNADGEEEEEEETQLNPG